MSYMRRGFDAISDDDGHSLTQSVDNSSGSGVPAHEHIPVTTRTKVHTSSCVSCIMCTMCVPCGVVRDYTCMCFGMS